MSLGVNTIGAADVVQGSDQKRESVLETDFKQYFFYRPNSIPIGSKMTFCALPAQVDLVSKEQNIFHGLEGKRSPLEELVSAGATSPALASGSSPSGAEHGLRAPAGGSGRAGKRTRPPAPAPSEVGTRSGKLSCFGRACRAARADCEARPIARLSPNGGVAL